MNFQDSPVQSKGTDKAPKAGGASDGKGRNANIMPGGKVDPRSKKFYNRSLANREGLGEYLKRLWNDGTDEADVFMAGVKSLMSRGHGYVGAYLDSKNPGRVYKENEAMAITDAVMSKEGIGSHPGNRLTRAKDEEGRKERKEANVARGGFGPKQAPGRKAMSVRQQRKEGPRPSGPALPPDSRRDREGLGTKETGPTSEWQNTLKDRMEGKATTADVIEAFQKEKQSRISESPQAQAQRKKAKAEDRARETAAPGAPEEEVEKGFLTGEQANEVKQQFKNNFQYVYNKKLREAIKEEPSLQRNPPGASDLIAPKDIDEIIDAVVEDTGLDSSLVSDYISNTFPSQMGKIGWRPKGATESTPGEQPQPGQSAPQAQKRPPLDRQAQANDDDVMRRATLMKGKKSQAAPEEQAPSRKAAPQIKYTRPNIEREWNEAARYPEFETAGIEAWKNAVENGNPAKLSELGDVRNVDLNYDSLDENKKNNFQKAFQSGVIETPIVGRFDDGSYELIAGNTRLSGLVKNGVDPTVMVVDIPSGEGEEPSTAPGEQAPASKKTKPRKVKLTFTNNQQDYIKESLTTFLRDIGINNPEQADLNKHTFTKEELNIIEKVMREDSAPEEEGGKFFDIESDRKYMRNLANKIRKFIDQMEDSGPQEQQRPQVSAAKKAVKEAAAAASSPEEFKKYLMDKTGQFKLDLGRRDAKTRIAQGAADKRAQKEEAQRVETEKEAQKAQRARERAGKKEATQPSLLTPKLKARKFPVPEETKPQPEPIPDPWEGEPTGPAKDVTQDQAPAQQQTPTRALPPARSPRPVSSRGGLRVRNQPTRKSGGEGFGRASKPNPKAVKEVMDVAKEGPSLEDFKTFLYNKQGDLFGKTGFETGSADTNPLEGGSTQPFPEGPEETAPSSQLPGSGGPTPPTAKAGQPGQQGLFRSGTLTPRTGKGFGSKPGAPAPKKPVETAQDRADRMKELTDSGMSSSAALNQMKKEGSVTPRTEGGKGRVRKAPSQENPKKTPVMDDVVRGAGNLARGIGKVVNQARERHNKSPGGRLFQVSERDHMSYEEFAQSVRSLMR